MLQQIRSALLHVIIIIIINNTEEYSEIPFVICLNGFGVAAWVVRSSMHYSVHHRNCLVHAIHIACSVKWMRRRHIWTRKLILTRYSAVQRAQIEHHSDPIRFAVANYEFCSFFFSHLNCAFGVVCVRIPCAHRAFSALFGKKSQREKKNGKSKGNQKQIREAATRDENEVGTWRTQQITLAVRSTQLTMTRQLLNGGVFIFILLALVAVPPFVQSSKFYPNFRCDDALAKPAASVFAPKVWRVGDERTMVRHAIGRHKTVVSHAVFCIQCTLECDARTGRTELFSLSWEMMSRLAFFFAFCIQFPLQRYTHVHTQTHTKWHPFYRKSV